MNHLITTDQFIWAGDTGTNRIMKFDLDGNFLYSWGAPGGQPGRLTCPHSVSTDQESNLYVADCFGGRVQKFAPQPDAIRQSWLGRFNAMQRPSEGGFMFMRQATAAILLLIAFAPTASAQAPRSTESADVRLQRLEDKDEIQRLLLDYGRHLDGRDFAAYSSLFAKDGEWIGGFGKVSGPASIKAFMEKNMGTGPNRANNYHLLSNFVITVEGDTATAWSRWAFVVPGPQGTVISQAGRYDDMLVREGGRWRFKRRTASNDTPPPAAR